MRTEVEARPTGGNAAELIVQAAQYERFAEMAGDVLAPGYRRLAADLCRRAADLMDPHGPSDARPAPQPASLKPRDPRATGEAARAFVELLTARRSGIDDDGAQLLGTRDPRPVLWVAVTAMTSVMNAVSDESAQALIANWGLTSAKLAEGVSSDG